MTQQQTRRGFLEGFALGAVGGVAALAAGTGMALAVHPEITSNSYILRNWWGATDQRGRIAYVEIVRETVHRMAQDAVGKAEKGKEMTLLKHYIAVLRDNNREENIQFGYGTFTGPRSKYVSVVDALHWNIYGKWGDVHDPYYWAQHSDGEWYII